MYLLQLHVHAVTRISWGIAPGNYRKM